MKHFNNTITVLSAHTNNPSGQLDSSQTTSSTCYEYIFQVLTSTSYQPVSIASTIIHTYSRVQAVIVVSVNELCVYGPYLVYSANLRILAKFF